MGCIREFIHLAYEDGNELECSGHAQQPGVYCSHELTPSEYLDFAQRDLITKKSSIFHRAGNSISNSKKAIDCRAVDILNYWGINDYDENKKWLDFTEKAKILASLGISTPQLISRINTYRNKVEHSFQIAKLDDARDFIEIAELYLGYTSRYIPKLYDYDEDNPKIYLGDYNQFSDHTQPTYEDTTFTLSLKRNDAIIIVLKHHSYSDDRKSIITEQSVEYLKNPQLYAELVKAYYFIHVTK